MVNDEDDGGGGEDNNISVLININMAISDLYLKFFCMTISCRFDSL